jgi:type II secretory ATPase GspE/PulE/Tfp pilus assembly ATPase PilB-like protein
MPRAAQDSHGHELAPAQAGGGSDATNTSYPDLLNTLIWNAIMERATDVHVHCVEEGMRVLHRVDGAIHPKLLLSQAEGRKLLNQLKSASGLTVTRFFAPLEGQIIWVDEDVKWEIRVTLTPVRDRESAHLRFLNVPRDEWDMSGLGVSTEDQERISAGLRALSGLVLITGATGSGKTTTMYSLAAQLDLRAMTTYSIEDPVEFRLPYAQQIEVDEQHGLTMHEGLRTILRMDPDLILVGEIRDQDSAIVASRAALSGRLVLATIHAQDAAGAVDALHYLGVPHHIIGSSLRLVIAQSLVRRICGCCARPRDLTAEDRELFSRFGTEPPENLLHADGCTECSSYGYKGRTGIFEVVPVDDEIGTVIGSGTHHREFLDYLRRRGVRPMVHDGLKKAVAGVTSVEEVSRICGLAAGAGIAQQTIPTPMEMVTR